MVPVNAKETELYVGNLRLQKRWRLYILHSKILMKVNGCLLKDRRKAGGQFVYSAKISLH